MEKPFTQQQKIIFFVQLIASRPMLMTKSNDTTWMEAWNRLFLYFADIIIVDFLQIN